MQLNLFCFQMFREGFLCSAIPGTRWTCRHKMPWGSRSPAEGWEWLPSTPGSAHTAPHSHGSTQRAPQGRGSGPPATRAGGDTATTILKLSIISGHQQKPALPPFVNKVLLETCQAHSFTLHCWRVTTNTTWPTKAKIFATGPFLEMVFNLCAIAL